MTLTVREIAEKLDAAFEGDGGAQISGVAGIREAEAGQIAFVANPRYAPYAAKTRASAVIVDENWSRPCPAALIRVKEPEKAFALVAAWFAPQEIKPLPGIHPSAVVSEQARIGKDVYIGPCCVIEANAQIGDRCRLYAGVYIGHNVVLGEECILYPHVSIREHCRLGDRVILHNGVVIGSDGFGYVQEGAERKKIPQIGIVVIGNDVEIGANTTVDRARFGQTRIGNGVKIDNLVMVAHNVIIGDNAVIIAQSGIAGSSCIGERTILAGQSGVTGHVVVGPDVIVGAQSGVSKDIPAKTFVLGSPALPFEKASKLNAHYARLPELKELVHKLEQRIAELEKKLSEKQRPGNPAY